MRLYFFRTSWLAVLCLLFCQQAATAQKIKSVAFSYAPETTGDLYNQRIPRKAFPVGGADFVILSRKSADAYAVERYGADLKTKWSSPIALLRQETVEAFSVNGTTALVITHRLLADQGSQALYARLIDLTTGKEVQQKKLQEAPSKSRRLNVALSEDGSKLVTYHTITQDEQLQSMQAQVFDASLQKLRDRLYDFRTSQGQVSARVMIDNAGFQYVTLLTDNAMRLSVRRYNNQDNEIKVMEVMVGGVFNGVKMYVIDAFYKVQQDSSLYAAVLVAEENTGTYQALKMVKFDYTINNMRFADEFQFTPAFTQKLNQATGAERMEDIYLSDILVSAEGHSLIMAEKKFTEGGETSPYHARELLLFAYDEYQKPTWNSVILKKQTAPSQEGFSGISYRANLFGNRLQLLTLETLKGKTDLYNRSLHLLTGAAEPPKAVGLNVANDMEVAYAKDFTTWLDERTIITVTRPSKASAGLRLSRLTFK
ncbi:hypothetical protein [Rufibacter sp. LB8]|nr:hypothetical protein [Rufibacter sp. LB8]